MFVQVSIAHKSDLDPLVSENLPFFNSIFEKRQENNVIVKNKEKMNDEKYYCENVSGL